MALWRQTTIHFPNQLWQKCHYEECWHSPHSVNRLVRNGKSGTHIILFQCDVSMFHFVIFWPWCHFFFTENDLTDIVALFSRSMMVKWQEPKLANDRKLILTLRPRRNGQHIADDIFKRIFINENVWILFKISLKFVPKGPINNIPALVQIMAWRRSVDGPLSERMMVSLPTHICVTRPQWVNALWPSDAIYGDIDLDKLWIR